MYDLTQEMVIEEHRKDLLREAERDYLFHDYPSKLSYGRVFYVKALLCLGKLLSDLGSRLQARYGVTNILIEPDALGRAMLSS